MHKVFNWMRSSVSIISLVSGALGISRMYMNMSVTAQEYLHTEACLCMRRKIQTHSSHVDSGFLSTVCGELRGFPVHLSCHLGQSVIWVKAPWESTFRGLRAVELYVCPSVLTVVCSSHPGLEGDRSSVLREHGCVPFGRLTGFPGPQSCSRPRCTCPGPQRTWPSIFRAGGIFSEGKCLKFTALCCAL